MRANLIRNPDAILKRAAKTTFAVLVICSGSYAWHAVAAERAALCAGQANRAHALAAKRMAIKPASPLARLFVGRAALPAKAGISRRARMPRSSSTTNTYPMPVIVRIKD